jgi:hypothetical protein
LPCVNWVGLKADCICVVHSLKGYREEGIDSLLQSHLAPHVCCAHLKYMTAEKRIELLKHLPTYCPSNPPCDKFYLFYWAATSPSNPEIFIQIFLVNLFFTIFVFYKFFVNHFSHVNYTLQRLGT